MKNGRGSMLFMTEIIAVILFFAICASICIQAFAKADLMSKEADELNVAVLKMENAAELWNADLIGNGEEDYYEYYDKDWNKVDTFDESGYALTICSIETEDNMQYCEMVVYTVDGDICSMSVGRHKEG